LKKGSITFFHVGRTVDRYRWLIVGLWMVFFAIALPFAPQAIQVLHAGGFVNPDFESERAITLLAQKLHFDPTIVQVIFTNQSFIADSPAFAQEAQQALTQVRGWSEVSGVISFADNPRQISLDRHAAYVNVLLKSDPDTTLTLGGGGWEGSVSIQGQSAGQVVQGEGYVELTGYT
jgi:putative drug exporter of the RND superfamily